MAGECRQHGCTNPRREDGRDAFANQFCSPQCEVTYDKRRMDAREAALEAGDDDE
ncbi:MULTISPECIES: hypothetical protein [Halorussus]|uniref:hypothetical protein n=1 Tax=Halorussus TaxID=1070314 RepID=UPI0020A09E5A|nr:hypothetical protein [Halorussus vallis]USZ75682.1 hypothetical protein NGM07_19915 [Halorussus vallis]USZ75757.1 hypothetical protein NGM07_00150 [Halorussus vallis]